MRCQDLITFPPLSLAKTVASTRLGTRHRRLHFSLLRDQTVTIRTRSVSGGGGAGGAGGDRNAFDSRRNIPLPALAMLLEGPALSP